MKQKLLWLSALFFSLVIGWTLGYLRMPYVRSGDSFWIGLLAGLGLVVLLISLLTLWQKHTFLLGILNKQGDGGDASISAKTYRLVTLFVALFIILSGVAIALISYNYNQQLANRIQQQDATISEQNKIIASVKQSNLVFQTSSLMADIRRELQGKHSNKLSDEMLLRIVSLSKAFQPYRASEGDSLSVKSLSPERGQLLLALTTVVRDSAIFAQIKRNTSFAGADLSGTNLSGADLSGVDLKGANLQDADLSNANLKNAAMKGANFWGANLNGANLSKADLEIADLRWARMNGIIIKAAKLNGADLSNTQLIKANLNRSTFLWAKFNGAMLNNANLQRADFLGASMQKANLENTNMRECRLRRTDLSDANLRGAVLTHSEIDATWFKDLEKWRTIGRADIQAAYEIVSIDASIYTFSKFRLERSAE